jgi:hypothetical protein
VLGRAMALRIFCHFQKVENQARAMVQFPRLSRDGTNFLGFYDFNGKST